MRYLMRMRAKKRGCFTLLVFFFDSIEFISLNDSLYIIDCQLLQNIKGYDILINCHCMILSIVYNRSNVYLCTTKY